MNRKKMKWQNQDEKYIRLTIKIENNKNNPKIFDSLSNQTTWMIPTVNARVEAIVIA